MNGSLTAEGVGGVTVATYCGGLLADVGVKDYGGQRKLRTKGFIWVAPAAMEVVRAGGVQFKKESEWFVGKKMMPFSFFVSLFFSFFLWERDFRSPGVVLLSSFYFLFLSVGGQEREVTWKVGPLPSCFQFSSYYRWEPAVGKKIGGRERLFILFIFTN